MSVLTHGTGDMDGRRTLWTILSLSLDGTLLVTGCPPDLLKEKYISFSPTPRSLLSNCQGEGTILIGVVVALVFMCDHWILP